MKKLMTLALAAIVSATAFAQNPDALKQVKKAKAFADAQAVIKANEASMSAAENAQAYNKCVDLLMAGINDAQTKFQTGQEAAVDMKAFYSDLNNAINCALACDKYDMQPNDKGKVAPKFRKANGQRLYGFRVHLINAGQDAYQADDFQLAGSYLGAYCASGVADLFAEAAVESVKNQRAQAKLMGQDPNEIPDGDPYIGDVARMAASASFNAGNKAEAIRYCEILGTDPERTEEALGYMRYFIESKLESHADSVAALGELEKLYEKYPTNSDLFADVASFYGMLGMLDKQDQLIDQEIARNPKSYPAWALRGNNLMIDGMKDPAKLDQAIECFKKAVEARDDNASLYVCIGQCYYNKASNAESDDAVLALLKEAAPFLEKARQIDPNHETANWPYLLYNCYYNLYGEEDARTKEIQKIVGM